MSDHYATLGVSRDASSGDIKKAYRKKQLERHPDKHGNTPEATETFRAIQHAYEVLSDPKRRAKHDLGQPDVEESPSHVGASYGFKTTGDVRQDLVVTSNSFAGLVMHTIKHGVHKNFLFLALAITALFTAGWWGWLLGIAAGASMVYSTKSWIKILADSPLVSRRAKK